MRRVALVLIAGLVGCGGSERAADSVGSTSAATTREAAPAIAGTTLDGEPIALADFRGRPVFVLVWSSW